MSDMLKKLEELKIVPVVKLDRASDAKALGDALCRGGLPVAEVTFRTDAAEESIVTMKTEFPNMCVGAGTVVNVEQAKRALNAGAEFIVSPGFSREVTEFAIENNIMIFPGICTPTEIMAAMEYDIPVVKFFPAKQYGGLDTIKALAAPFPSLKFMPTGGINAENIKEFLACNKIIACGGSWMVNPVHIDNKNFNEIVRITKEAVDLVH
ncbi:bifunctional 4-hydroxy-2-oxoglutarate aldolase/2-dehydro-3-deoxy-phosphogluconate aldolase [Faecalicatena contorta]|uniref:2-dehydro-3-deoxy-phosphogluconate aldolase n=1 Tax=Faecalicatena contorta TaxID=39482 RepID=A0A315ZW18_9FIRM|nr:bifunctional 4-hydroxy-2-oxoglutarate aldolase/2-dehydro-3-deoxy-phosphogluconate aldolase [Faecalicatena contorta]PWJ49826.1 2-keto-3-deoxy-phosphogluconate aldolase [Faecalicatena contorta]SUQ14544.1 2-keto-3-deoxy-phosphogluconate aldolase [Faecalicatena contorta]